MIITYAVPIIIIYHNYHLHLPPEGDLGDTNLWELLEQLNLQELVAVGGLEAKVGDDYKDGDHPFSKGIVVHNYNDCYLDRLKIREET